MSPIRQFGHVGAITTRTSIANAELGPWPGGCRWPTRVSAGASPRFGLALAGSAGCGLPRAAACASRLGDCPLCCTQGRAEARLPLCGHRGTLHLSTRQPRRVRGRMPLPPCQFAGPGHSVDGMSPCPACSAS
jgi:hypothetical protein